RTHVMHARVFGTPSTTIRQSKQTPIPQKIPRGSPPTVLRVSVWPRASSTAATVSPSNASTGSPSSRIVTRGPRSRSGPSGSLDKRHHLLREALERAVGELDREPRRARPEEQPLGARALDQRVYAGRDLLRRADQVPIARQLVGARELLAAAPLAIEVELVEEVGRDLAPGADVDRGVDRDARAAQRTVEPDHAGLPERVRHQRTAEAVRTPGGRRARAADPQRRPGLLERRRGPPPGPPDPPGRAGAPARPAGA